MTTRNDLPFFKFVPGDWFKGDIRHCCPETKGVFVQLCAQMWIDGGTLTDDERLPAICGCDKQSFSKARAELDLWQILRYNEDGSIYISFIKQQLTELSALREARAQAGRKGGNTKQLNRRSKAKAKSKQSSSIKNKNKNKEQEEEKENTPLAPQGGNASASFDMFWKAYPNKKGKKVAFKAWTKAKDKPDIETIIKAIEAQKGLQQWKKDGGEFIPHPTTWINQCRWDDVVKPEIEKKFDPYELDRKLKLQREIQEMV